MFVTQNVKIVKFVMISAELWTLVIGYFWKWGQPTDYLIICQQTTDCRLSPWLCANEKRQFVPRDHVLILQVVWFVLWTLK